MNRFDTMRLILVLLFCTVCRSFVSKGPLVVSLPFPGDSLKTTTPRGWKTPAPFVVRRGNAIQLEGAAAETAIVESEKPTSVALDPETVILADAKDFIKPDRDRHEYRYIKLKNNLQVLLVSTAGAKTSEDAAQVEAASIHVQAGHFDDTIPGLAHFHEHMLVSTGSLLFRVDI